DAAEIDLLVLELSDRDDFRKAVEPFEERIFDRLAETARQLEELLGGQILLAEEDDEVFEPDRANRPDRLAVEIARNIDPGDLRSDGAGDLVDFELAHCG